MRLRARKVDNPPYTPSARVSLSTDRVSFVIRLRSPVGRIVKGMPLGTSIFLIATGAILRYAVTVTVSGIDIATVGLILMIVGIIGLVMSVLYMFAWSPRRGRVVRDRVIERDPDEPSRPY
jgi:Domain of unknown function (DUF6458)